MGSIDCAIQHLGVSATLRKAKVKVYDEYDHLIKSQTSWEDTSVKIFLAPKSHQTMEELAEGFHGEKPDLRAMIESTASLTNAEVAAGEVYIVYDGSWYRVISVSSQSYASTTVKRVTLSWEEDTT